MKRDDFPITMELSAEDESARTVIECLTAQVFRVGRVPIYDVNLTEPLHFAADDTPETVKAQIRNAVWRLDASQLLYRPVAGHPELVSFFPEEA